MKLIKLKIMKKLLFAVIGLFTMFTFNSCELLNENCKDQFDKVVIIESISIDILVHGWPVTNQPIGYTVTKHRCDGSTTDMNGIVNVDELGRGTAKTNYTLNLHNTDDYIEVKMRYFSVDDQIEYYESKSIFPTDVDDQVLRMDVVLKMNI